MPYVKRKFKRPYSKKRFVKRVKNVIHNELDKNYYEVNYDGPFSLDKW